MTWVFVIEISVLVLYIVHAIHNSARVFPKKRRNCSVHYMLPVLAVATILPRFQSAAPWAVQILHDSFSHTPYHPPDRIRMNANFMIALTRRSIAKRYLRQKFLTIKLPIWKLLCIVLKVDEPIVRPNQIPSLLVLASPSIFGLLILSSCFNGLSDNQHWAFR